jgi:diguanylate cyclase (GGDEF)-like protein/PAS domain S-box-containing protein
VTASLQILIVEDQEADYLLLDRRLRSALLNCDTTWVRTQDGLVAALPGHDWDLIITDYALPGTNIRRILRLLIDTQPEVPIVLLSGLIGEQQAVDLLHQGIEDFVNKDNPSRLLPAIQRALRKREESRARREAQQALEDSERRYRRLYEDLRRSEARLMEAQAVARIANWELAPDTQETFWSKAVYHLLDLPEDTPAGPETLRRLIHPDDRDEVMQALQKALREGAEYAAEYRIITPSGNQLWVNCRANPAHDAEGRFVRLSGVVQDVTTRRRFEDQQRQAATVFENTAEGVYVTDPEGQILNVNPAFTEITGYALEDVIGKTPEIWRSDRHDETFYRQMRHDLDTQGRWQGEIWNRRKDGSLIPEWLNISVVRDDAGRIMNYVAVFTDITALKRSQEELERLAHYDALTGLPNRLLLQARMAHAIEQAKRAQTSLALIFLDLDRFKNINDSFGHLAGDKLLQLAADRLVHCVRRDDTVARISGDEFVLLLETVNDAAKSARVAEKVLASFSDPFDFDGRSVHVTASMGICAYPRDGADVQTLLRNADAAMYRAKEQGRMTYQFYTQELTTRVRERVTLESSLRRAAARGELRLVYQPQVSLADGRLRGVEALLRWRHPELGDISPVKFIPVAEECGAIIGLGEWVLREACEQACQWREAQVPFHHIAVNVAGPQLRADFVGEVKRTLSYYALPADCLEFEVTENFIMREVERGVAALEGLQALGTRLAIDDFGTGYSSLSYLKRLPIDKLKIDQSFVRDIPDDADDMAIAEAVIALGRSLRLDVVAEGVETTEQAVFLSQRGCDQAQGYLYSRPIDADAATSWLRHAAASPLLEGGSAAGT